jgi:hypothetical protein
MVRILGCISLLVALTILSGCGLGSSSPSISQPAAVKATGSVHGGQQPVTGATIQLWAVGTTGFGSAATPLISATVTTSDGTGATNSNSNAGNSGNTLPAGQFTLNFTNAYTCPSAGTLVYMTATGGNPGLGGSVNNSAIVMLTALGQCGSLSSSTFISLNEVTTAGTVEALAPFLSAGGSIGSPSDSVSLQAIANAFAAVNKIVNTSTGAALGGFPKLNTLANAMVQCVNSTGPTSSNCVTLFADATPSGGTTPTTVLGALLNIALNPTLNGTAIYNLSTPNAPFQPASTGAPAVWNITTSGAVVSACGYGAGGNDVSGTVSYSGTQTGRIYLALNNINGCDVGTEGTSIAAPGAFTIHGVPPGNYTLQAFMDTQGYGNTNAINPTGSAAVTVGNPNVTGANVTLADPATVTITSAPGIRAIGPYNGGAVVQLSNAVTNSNGVESATSYTLQWSTSSSFSPIAGSKAFPATGTDLLVWFVNGLSNSTAYYFRYYATSGGTAQGPYSPTYGPVTIGAATSGSAVSGSIGFTGTATGPLYAGFYNQDNFLAAPFVQSIASPFSLQPYSVNVTNSSSAVYIPVAVIDQNNNGIVDPGDITNINFQGGPIAITGATSNQNLTLPTGNVNAHVTTQVTQSGSTTSYGLYFQLNFLAKLPVAVTLLNSYNTDGANIDNGPLDVASCAVPNTNCSLGQNGFQIYFNLGSTAPTTGDTYLFNVAYSDGTSETLAVQVTNVLTAFATNLAPQTGGSTSTTPTFTWTDPVCGACSTYTYDFYINNSSGTLLWYVPGFGNGLPPGTTSLTWGADPTNSTNTPSVGSLTLGSAYSWSVIVQDSNYNQATTVVTYQP